MGASQFDVLIIGGGCAGLSASIGLAKAGFRVVVVEAAPFPGAENWSGCVYFAENLAHPALLGPQAVEELAWERRLVERGFFLSDGYSLFGFRYRDAEAFRHCYTVLRPIFDHHLAHLAAQAGVVVLNATTAQSLIREGNRVIGAATNRGPVYANLTFLAEGDASHLLAREGLERQLQSDGQPTFLHGIKQVIELPPGAVEANFDLGPDEGAAYEIVLRNGTLKGKPLHLNMGGFLYTNRQSLSIGLVLPAEHLARNFEGDPNLLLQWFESLPQVQRWCRGGRRGVFGAKLIRGGGVKDIPILIGDGLAVGGAATALGTDFPYPNYTGPATRMGLLIVEAAKAIRARGGSFSEEELRQHYLLPLQQTRIWKDVEFLRRWPSYVERTQWFFDGNVDVCLKTAYVWTRPWRWNRSRILDFARLLLEQFAPGRWLKLREDWKALRKALRFKKITGKPAVGRLLLHGWLNALRDLLGLPRVGVPPAGQMRIVFRTAGQEASPSAAPWFVRRWAQRFLPVLGASARRVYANDEEPLESKLRHAVALLLQQVNLLDLTLALFAFTGVALLAAVLHALRGIRRTLRWPEKPVKGHLAEYVQEQGELADLTRCRQGAAAAWEGRLGELHYDTPAPSHIHVHWPTQLDKRFEIVKDGLWHVCPAHVYEARPGPMNQIQIVVNHENCIKCETCWRTTETVDWGRDGRHRFIYPVASAASVRVQEAAGKAGTVQPSEPKIINVWQTLPSSSAAFPHAGLVETLDRKLRELVAALDEEPRTVDAARADHLVRLGTYAEQVAHELVQRIAASGDGSADRPSAPLAREVAARAGRLTHWLRQRRYAWAVAEGQQIRQHHLAGLRHLLGSSQPTPSPERRSFDHHRREMRLRLEEILPATVWRSLEPEGTRHQGTRPRLAPHQEQAVLDLLAGCTPTGGWLHQPVYSLARKALLAELAVRDPSLAFRASSHLLACDLAGADPSSAWSALGVLEPVSRLDQDPQKMAWFVPDADHLFLLDDDHVLTVPPDSPNVARIDLAPLGLRGAGVQKVVVKRSGSLPEKPARWQPATAIWEQMASADLLAMAVGIADTLVERAVEHANTRVQFPGLYSDDEARDTIAKFGAVKKLLAQMACRRHLLHILAERLPPGSLRDPDATHLVLMKALTAELLGTAPGSISYNAGQIFGGTGYSEDDVLAKLYRDSAPWRYLGPANPTVWRRHGKALVQTGQLSEWAGEVERFDQIAQRKALLPELEQLRHLRKRLRTCLANVSASADDASGFAVTQMALARLDAVHLATKAFLLDLHDRLENGEPVEEETALLQCWLDEAEFLTLQVEQRVEGSKSVAVRMVPGATSAESPASREYELFLATPLPYDTGDYLVKPADLTAPRLTPELAACDAGLSDLDRRYRELFREQFGKPRDGQPYERWLEDRHCPAQKDLDFLRQHGCFRFLIPKSLGGEGLRKADYYLMVQNAQREADVATALTIQVNASLGTTPIFLARDKDIPKSRKELAQFVANHDLHRQVETELERLSQQKSLPQIRHGMESLRQIVEKHILGSTAARVVCHRFLAAWHGLARALQEHDLTACLAELRHAAEGWHHACAVAPDLLSELDRRAEACDLYLRLIAAGEISAFALTEPSAGSDTARLASRARLHSVPLEKDEDGVLTFVPHGCKEPRVLVDARRIEVREDGIYYRWSDEAPPSRIQCEEYDYATDNPGCRRYYLHGSRKVWFSDIGQVRERGGKLWYDYWEINGSKMWITNGRIMGVLVLYARTEEGVTGFLVDRHAEGLIVGKDERKLGQCGSPTNELSLISLRVPRENVLGLEGRGQVNALETLNLGRAGIAMSSLASLQTVVAACRDFWQRGLDVPDASLERWLQTNQYLAEAISFDLVGRLEHPQSRSLRIEASIAKFLVTELLHETIELAEDIHGLAGQTQEFVIEKRKRDARVLTIYEGTNEIQRSLIWTHLVNEVASRWQDDAGSAPGQPKALQPLLDEYLRFRSEFRQRLKDAVEKLGANLIQNPSFQASCFELAEAAAWLKAMECVLGRLAWQHRFGLGDASLGLEAWQRCRWETAARLLHFDLERERHRKGLYAPAIRAASLVLNRQARKAVTDALSVSARIELPFDVLVVLEYEPVTSNRPLFWQDRLMEVTWTLTAAARSALECALTLRDRAPDKVQLHAAVVGGPELAGRVREVLAHGLSGATLITCPTRPIPYDLAAKALALHFQKKQQTFNLVLTPKSDSRSEDGLLGMFLAAELGWDCHAYAHQLAVRHTADASEIHLQAKKQSLRRPLPAVIEVPTAGMLRDFSTSGYFKSLCVDLEIVPWPEALPSADLRYEPDTAADAERTTTTARAKETLETAEAAQLLLDELGLGSESPVGVDSVIEPILPVSEPSFLHDCQAVAVLASDSQGRLTEGARTVVTAALLAGKGAVVILVPPEESAQHTAARQAASFGASRVVLLEVPKEALLLAPWKRRIVLDAWPGVKTQARFILGESWLEPIWPQLRQDRGGQGELLLRALRFMQHGQNWRVVTRRGKLTVVRRLPADQNFTHWITFLPEAGLEKALPPSKQVKVQRWLPTSVSLFAPDAMAELLAQVKQDAGAPDLREAEFIIDVGFGIGNRDGYEAIVPPLEQALRSLGVTQIAIGGSRKVTEELRILPVDRQIGQSGVSVRPRILLAIGISGAPQHLSYIDPRATIIAFNRDPEAPIMTLNRRQARPRVFGVVGDLFETIPAFIEALQSQGQSG